MEAFLQAFKTNSKTVDIGKIAICKPGEAIELWNAVVELENKECDCDPLLNAKCT